MSRLDSATGRPAGALRLLAAAAGLLTRLPVRADVAVADLPGATAAMPVIGVGVAAVAVALRAGGEPLVGAPAATVAAVLAAVAVTGALHEDGLADVADGLGAGRDPAARLAVMRDSHVGVYGVVALAGALGLQVALLAPLPLPAFVAAVVAGHVLARGAVPALARWMPTADGRGLAAGLAGGPSGWGWLVVAVSTVGAAAAAAALVGGWWWAPVPLAVAALTALAAAGGLRRLVGGISGDGYGATILVTQVAVIAAVAALWRLIGAG